ncbi:MAG: Type 1 glutamine amidotransferase-like domain-containing protein [Dehalococcoidia bacterium]|jgi:cyanophycinase-like exopeptidase
MAQPLIALVGGDEFRPPDDDLDRYLLERLGRDVPRVAILPTAARDAPRLAAEHGVRHFQTLGADAIAVMAVDKRSADDERLVAELDGVDLAYLAGGDPLFLLETLRDSLLWRRLTSALPEGCAIAGSSAGAMVLGQTMGYQGKWTEALGLLPGICALPHFQEWGREALPRLEKRSSERGLTLLGIDGATGCVGRGRDWEVRGPGVVTVIRGGASRVFRSGEHITLGDA